MEATKKSVVEYFQSNYDEATLQMEVDCAVSDYLDDDWEDEFENEFDAYQERGRGEAESQVRTEIMNTILGKLGMTHDEYESAVGEPLWDTVNGVFEFLNV